MYYRHYTKRFQKSFKKIARSGKIKREEVEFVIDVLASVQKLDRKYQDHPLQGNFEGFRECHIRPDILLIYYIKNQELVLVLFDMGTHSELF
ncbi:MAG: type II toxin-antitoxin system YafQ family toxin [Patescibacteria group bacterium]